MRPTGRVVERSAGACFMESVERPAEGQVVIASLGIGGAQIHLPGGVDYLEANVGLAVRFREAPATIIGVPRREIASRLAA